jgi:hypothetical protein
MPSFSASFGRQMMQKRRAIRQKRECAEDAEGTESMFAIAAAAIAEAVVVTNDCTSLYA